ncbi:PucR family transcriptional regulator [Kocuria sp.]|uniref:PucR family transcriptional regulator n=1 Tax=Kocuria sp. TaxID=1871328 RepID=UPI0026DEB0B4|nr:PucR family transcriptional regulator [Kocuria sp.]MDO5618277.1 helix-turn-helix domain-containing protein [Kocuria sp.]
MPKETTPESENTGAGGKDRTSGGFLVSGSRWILGGRSSRTTVQRTARTGAPVPSKKTLENIRANVGTMSGVAVQKLEAELPWFRELRPKDRSELGLVAQRGIAAFVTWYEQQDDDGMLLNRLFRDAPTDLARAISLQQALQVMRVVVEVVEDNVPELATSHDESVLREGVLRYSRDIAFAAADVYARAAENRGSWDARLEALVVDGVLRGEHTDSLRSRVAALGWTSTGPVTVMVGYAPDQTSPAGVARIRRTLARHTTDALVSIQGNRLVLILAGLSTLDRSLERIVGLFGPGPVVHGPEATNLFAAADSAEPAHAALTVAPAWPEAPRPVDSEELWPERLMAGDTTAREALVEQIYRKLEGSSTGLTETLSTYVCVGHSLEATARELFVHANTVRYRLRRISDVTGWDPLIPRDAFVLHCAIIAGRLADDCHQP